MHETRSGSIRHGMVSRKRLREATQLYSIGKESTPQSMVLFMLDQHKKTRADLVPLLGSKGRVSEFLNGKRRLSMAQVGALRQEFGIPADLLIEQVVEGAAVHSYSVRGAKPSNVREDSPRYELGKGHVGGGELALTKELLARVDALAKSVEANTRVMKALLAELKGKR